MGKICPKHVELILEINKTVIVASRWFLYYLTYNSQLSRATPDISIKFTFTAGSQSGFERQHDCLIYNF